MIRLGDNHPEFKFYEAPFIEHQMTTGKFGIKSWQTQMISVPSYLGDKIEEISLLTILRSFQVIIV